MQNGRTKGKERSEDAHIRLDMYRQRHPLPWTADELREWGKLNSEYEKEQPTTVVQLWLRATKSSLDMLERCVGALRMEELLEAHDMIPIYGEQVRQSWIEK